MKVLVDMNLGLGFVVELQALGIEARHWSQVGALDAPDSVIMEWSRREGFVVLTSDQLNRSGSGARVLVSVVQSLSESCGDQWIPDSGEAEALEILHVGCGEFGDAVMA